jgi:hypothetical protein
MKLDYPEAGIGGGLQPLHCCQLRLGRQRQQCGLDAVSSTSAIWNPYPYIFPVPVSCPREHPVLVEESFADLTTMTARLQPANDLLDSCRSTRASCLES